MKRVFEILLAIIMCCVLINTVRADMRIFDVSQSTWKEAASAVPSSQIYNAPSSFDGRSGNSNVLGADKGFNIIPDASGVRFSILGNPPGRRSMIWENIPSDKFLNGYSYYLLRYKTIGIVRDFSIIPIITLYGKDSTGKDQSVVLFDSSNLINDNIWHCIFVKKPFDLTIDKLSINVQTEDSSASFSLGALEFYKDIPDSIRGFDYRPAADILKFGSYKSLNLDTLYNDKISNVMKAILEKKNSYIADGDISLVPGRIVVEGIPFTISSKDVDIVRPDSDGSANSETVKFLDANVSKNNFMPVSRDRKTIIPVNAKVSEVYMLLAGDFKPYDSQYYGPVMPFRAEDIESFAVELRYADGDVVYSYPYSLTDKGFVIQRMMGAYAVPVDLSRKLESVIIHNKTYEATISLIAATVNTSKNAKLSSIWKEPKLVRVPTLKAPVPQKAGITRVGDILRIRNNSCNMDINCKDGFRIQKIVNRWSPSVPIVLDSASGLEVVSGGTLLTGSSFSTEGISVTGSVATVKLKSKSPAVTMLLTITIEVSDSGAVNFRAVAANYGQADLAATIRFPCVRNVNIGSGADTWLFYPKYRNVITNDKCFYVLPNDRSYRAQFMDIFNPQKGIGIAYLTHNRDNSDFEYGAQKDDRGVSAYINYSAEFYTVKPGKNVNLTETAIILHSGDWHSAMNSYKEWLATWYHPASSPGMDWYKKSFLLRTHMTSDKISERIAITPSMYDRKKGEYRISEILEADKQYWRMMPDIVHFYYWAYDDVLDDSMWGEYATESYKNVGGLPLLKESIRHLQEDLNIAVSMYFLTDRFSGKTKYCKDYSQEAVARYADGTPMISNDSEATCWWACVDTPVWRDHFVKQVVQVQKDTGIKIVYLDVFSYSRDHQCFASNHGHQVPLSCNKASLTLLQELRKSLPKDVIIWCEFPVSDVNSQYVNGNIIYSELNLSEFLAKSRDINEAARMYFYIDPSVYRYCLPNVKQWGFPVGIEADINWGKLKLLFFNGMSIYDTTWRLFPSSAMEIFSKAQKLQHTYSDCFSSSNPKPMVQTERTGVYANCFPGDGKVAWTIFNSRYTTVKGNILAVPHYSGDTYYDAWNGKMLKVNVRNGLAYINLTLYPQALGCVIQTHPTRQTSANSNKQKQTGKAGN